MVYREYKIIKWLINKTKGVNILGKYIEKDDQDLKIIIFDFSGNEIYRSSHMIPLIERLDKFLFFFDLTSKESFQEVVNLFGLVQKNK